MDAVSLVSSAPTWLKQGVGKRGRFEAFCIRKKHIESRLYTMAKVVLVFCTATPNNVVISDSLPRYFIKAFFFSE
jgi:hypothetical protein